MANLGDIDGFTLGAVLAGVLGSVLFYTFLRSLAFTKKLIDRFMDSVFDKLYGKLLSMKFESSGDVGIAMFQLHIAQAEYRKISLVILFAGLWFTPLFLYAGSFLLRIGVHTYIVGFVFGFLIGIFTTLLIAPSYMLKAVVMEGFTALLQSRLNQHEGVEDAD